MTDRPTDDELGSLLDRYRRPPEMPAESLWAAIDGASAPGQPAVAGRRAGPARVWLAAAAVVLFALGGLAGYAIAGAGHETGVVPLGAVAGDEGDVRIHRITWF